MCDAEKIIGDFINKFHFSLICTKLTDQRIAMAIGEKIHHFRLLHGFTQKYLGKMLGFSDIQTDVCIAQYKKGSRNPKEII